MKAGVKACFCFCKMGGEILSNTELIIKSDFEIKKFDDEKRLAFGWASGSLNEEGKIIEDSQGDIIEPDVLESAAYKFVKLYREAGEMHERGGCGVLVESIFFTKEKMAVMGIPEGTLPVGWWIGFEVTDDDTWEGVKKGKFTMFSIEGEAIREEVS